MNQNPQSSAPRLCPNCGGDIAIRNPTGKCDHLYYPENVPANKSSTPVRDTGEGEMVRLLQRLEQDAIDAATHGAIEHGLYLHALFSHIRSLQSRLSSLTSAAEEVLILRKDLKVCREALELDSAQFHHTKAIISALVANGSPIDGTAVMMDCEHAIRRQKKALSSLNSK